MEIYVTAISIAAGTDTTPTMKKKDTKYHILYQNNNMLLQKKKQINKKKNLKNKCIYIYKSLK